MTEKYETYNMTKDEMLTYYQKCISELQEELERVKTSEEDLSNIKLENKDFVFTKERYNDIMRMFTHLMVFDMTILSMLGMKDKDIDDLNQRIRKEVTKAYYGEQDEDTN